MGLQYEGKQRREKIANTLASKPRPTSRRMFLDKVEQTRDSTPCKPRPYKGSESLHTSVHDYLFQLSKEKDAEEKTKDRKKTGEKLLSEEEKEKIVDRLYERSISRQIQGKERRNAIARSITPKRITSSRKQNLTVAQNEAWSPMIEASYISYSSSTSTGFTNYLDSLDDEESICSRLTSSTGASLLSEPVFPTENSSSSLSKKERTDKESFVIQTKRSFELKNNQISDYGRQKRFECNNELYSSNANGKFHICDRLYSMGLRSQTLKEEQQRIKKVKEEEEEKKKQQAPLRINRYYAPLKPRPYEASSKSKSVHDYLFNLAKERRYEELVRQCREVKQTEKSISESEKKEVVCRLYERSTSLQSEGKKRREKIAEALAPREVPQKKISLDKAIALYDRLLAKKKEHIEKIEEVRNKYLSPLKARNTNVFGEI